ncbi:MAG: uncharacterized protein H6Q18_616 [Bacteroidetes bacterium]|nr:uncharacterized protein [Bacteroidota bacterium]
MNTMLTQNTVSTIFSTMKRKLITAISIFIYTVIITSCNPEDFIKNPDAETDEVTKTELASDYEWDETTVKTITFNGALIRTSSKDVTINNDTATITAGGYYRISGNLTDGQLVINAPKKLIKIELNGASVSNSTTSPFYIKSATKVILFLKSGTVNTFTDASAYSNTSGANATISSEAYLGFTGEGTLTVSGNYNDGISCDDPIVIKSGKVNVTAKDDAIRSKDYVVVHGGEITASGVTGHALKSDSTGNAKFGYIKIDGGNFNLSSSLGDGIHAYKNLIIEDGTFNITSDDSQALRSDSAITISGGTINVTNSKQGIECPYIVISGGTSSFSTSKATINATYGNSPTAADNSLLVVSGGKLIVSSASNALVSDGNIKISGGTTIIQGPSSTSKLMAKYLGEFTVNGGTFIGCGPNAGTKIQGFSVASTQNNILIKSSSIGTNLFSILDSGGNPLVAFKPVKTSYYVLFSSPALTAGSNYSIYTGGSYSGGTNTYGYMTDGSYSTAGATLKTTATLSLSGTVNSITF